jgi:hypothetical protein
LQACLSPPYYRMIERQPDFGRKPPVDPAAKHLKWTIANWLTTVGGAQTRLPAGLTTDSGRSFSWLLRLAPTWRAEACEIVTL